MQNSYGVAFGASPQVQRKGRTVWTLPVQNLMSAREIGVSFAVSLCAKRSFKTHHSHCIGAESTAGAFTQLSDEAPQALTWELRARRSLESPGSDPNRQGQDREPVVPLHVEQVRGSGFSCERTLNNYRASTMMRHQRPCKPSISRSKAPIFCVLACARCTPYTA